jgi:hypothetical protein
MLLHPASTPYSHTVIIVGAYCMVVTTYNPTGLTTRITRRITAYCLYDVVLRYINYPTDQTNVNSKNALFIKKIFP